MGARRLVAELDKKKIVVSESTVYTILKRNGLQTRKKRLLKFEEQQALEVRVTSSAVYTILKRNNVENRQKRLLKLEERQALEAPPAPEAEGPESLPEQLKIELPPAVDEVPEAVFEPAVVLPMPPEDEMPVPADMPGPVPGPAVVAPAEPERPPLRKAPVKPIKKRGRWVFYPLYLLLFALIGYLGFHAFQVIQTARIETEPERPLNLPQLVSPRSLKAPLLCRLLTATAKSGSATCLTSSRSKEPDSEKKISLDKLALAKKNLGLEFVGTVVADDPVMSRAIIDNRSIKKQEAYREGDTAGKVKIKKILRNNVVITTAKGDELLTVEIKESAKRSTSYGSAQRVGSQSSSAQRLSGSRRPSARTRSISLNREEVAASLADTEKLLQQMQISPYMFNDEPTGFKIGRIPSQSVLRKMGLRSRDIIMGVNDETITGPEQAADFFPNTFGGRRDLHQH